jgi:hypothetical protein
MAIPNTWILSAEEIPDERTCSAEGFDVEYRRVWIVTTKDPRFGPAIVRGKSELPLRGDTYQGFDAAEYDPRAKVTRINVVPFDNDAIQWRYEVDYSTRTDVEEETQRDPTNNDPGDATPDEDPTLRKAKISWLSIDFKRPLRADLNNKPVCNSAGQFFRPLPEVDRSWQVVRLTRYQSTFDQMFYKPYSFATNSDEFRMPRFGVKVAGVQQYEHISVGQARCMPIHSEREWINNKEWALVTFVLAFKYAHPDPVPNPWNDKDQYDWQVHVWDVGTMSRDADGRLRPILRDGMPVTEPVPLNGQGQEIVTPPPTSVPAGGASDTVWTNWLRDNMKMLNFDGYFPKPFLDLELDEIMEAIP